MASGWDQGLKKVIRDNGRNQGSNIWDVDAIGGQVIDSQGHDTNDQTLADSITETLNLDGWNEMKGALNVGDNKILALAPGTAGTDGVNWTQLDVVVTDVTNNTLNIAVNANAISINEGNINDNTADIAALGTTFVTDNFKSNGPIRHLLGVNTGSATLDLAVQGRFFQNNDGALTLTFTNLPSADDPDLGAIYRTEVSISIWNDGTPGTITLAGLGTPRVVGTQSTDASIAQILTVFIDRDTGTNNITVVWSAA